MKNFDPNSPLDPISEELFDWFLLNVNDGFWDWHIPSGYEYMSPRFWEMFGYTPEEKEHHCREWQDMIHPDDLKIALSNFQKHVETMGEHPYFQEVRYRHKNGSQVTVICRGKVIEWDNAGNPLRMIGVHTDITSGREHLEKQIRQAQKLECVGRLAGGIAHDINNCLMAVVINTTLAKDKITHDPEASELLDRALLACEKSASTIKRLLAFSKQHNLEPEVLDLNQVIQESLNLLENTGLQENLWV